MSGERRITSAPPITEQASTKEMMIRGDKIFYKKYLNVLAREARTHLISDDVCVAGGVNNSSKITLFSNGW